MIRLTRQDKTRLGLEAEEAAGLPEVGNQPPAGPVDEPVDSEDEFDF